MIPRRVLFAGLLCVVSFTQAVSAATPQELLQRIPALPTVAADADCDVVDGLVRDIERASATALVAAQQAMSGTTSTAVFSDAQGRALERIMDPALQACVEEAEVTRSERFDPPVARLRQDIDHLVETRIVDHARCGNEQNFDEACGEAVMRRHEEAARTEANRFLAALGPVYGEWSGKLKRCVDDREAAFAAFRKAKVGGPFATQGLNARVHTWMTVQTQATAWRDLCRASHEAAHALDRERN